MTVGIVGLGWLLAQIPAHALITVPTPLRDIVKQSTFIVAATVASVDAEKPELVLDVAEALKGKAPLRKLAVHLKGDAEAKKKKHVPQLLKRVAPRLPLLLFILQRDKKYTALAYTNGTWFQIIGVEADGAVRWSLTHGEPYLRRTFKGSTAELKQAVLDGLAGKRDPPKPDTKEKPGFGPEVPAHKQSVQREPAVGNRLFAVIPTIFMGGPLALLALLLPVVFGGLMLVLRRWLAALSVLSLNCTLYAVQDVCRRWLAASWWAAPSMLWSAMTALTLLGLLWAWRRQVSTLASESSPPASPKLPNRIEVILLAALSVLCLVLTAFALPRERTPLDLRSKLLLTIVTGLWAGMLYTLYQRWIVARRGTLKTALPGEGILLGTMLLVSVAFSATAARESNGVMSSEEGVSASGQWRYRVAWRFRPNVERCWMASSPRGDGERIYIGAVLPSAFGSSGAVYGVDRQTGQEIWIFNDGGSMKGVFSSPCLADGRLYIGEGFHEHVNCKLYCLDAKTGKKQWDFPTTSHTESTPCVAAGKVYFGAGDDGLYCLDAVTGQELWHRKGWHVDASPLVIDNRLYGGSGLGEDHKETVLFCLNADTGEVNWRVAVDLPVWGMPVVHGEYLYAGIGNGNFLESADRSDDPHKPAGALLCLERATGKRVWRYDVADGIHVRPCVDDRHIWFAGRDRHCYCLQRRDGALCWKTDLGSPIVASPCLAGCSEGAGLYVAASEGRVNRLDPQTGAIEWTFDVGKDAEQPARLLSSPLVQVHGGCQGPSRSIWFGCGLSEFTQGIVYCLEENAVLP